MRLNCTGVAAWMQRSPHEAKGWWEHAEHLYAEIDEREGRARCLQHLGSAEVVAGRFDEALNCSSGVRCCVSPRANC